MTYFPSIKEPEQTQAETNLSNVVKNLPLKNHLDIVNGKIIFRTSDLFKAMGIDHIG